MSWSTSVTSGKSGDRYGYHRTGFLTPRPGQIGSIADNTFELNGKEFEIGHIVWDDQLDKVSFYVKGCLVPSDFASLKIGANTTLTRPSKYYYDDDTCTGTELTSDPFSGTQTFEFNDVASNPFPDGSRVNVTLRVLSKPTSIMVNGYSPPETENGRTRQHPKLKLRWNRAEGAARYEVKYRKECYPSPETYHTLDDDIRTHYISVTPVPCSPSTVFEETFLRVAAGSSSTVTHTISGLDADSPLEKNAVYRIHVRALFGSSNVPSTWSVPVIGYPSDTSPSNIATIPIKPHLSIPSGNRTPAYRYTICNDVASDRTTTSDDDDIVEFPSITTVDVTRIVNAFNEWGVATSSDGFWKGGSSDLISVTHQASRKSECGNGLTGTRRDLKDNNLNLNEIKITDMEGMDMFCGNKDSWGCALTDAYFVDELLSSVDYTRTYGTCNRLYNVAVHELGHALGILGTIPTGMSTYLNSLHHSHVKPSIMHGAWGASSEARNHCSPTYYDIAAIVAAYQSKIK